MTRARREENICGAEIGSCAFVPGGCWLICWTGDAASDGSYRLTQRDTAHADALSVYDRRQCCPIISMRFGRCRPEMAILRCAGG